MSTQKPIQAVEKPIICSPYVEPDAHWDYDKVTGVPQKPNTRRPAGYWYKLQRTGTVDQPTLPGMEEKYEDWDDLPLVNMLRDDVRRWREAGYVGASHVTRELLQWWGNPKRGRRLFFCQREAVETIIYLAEMRIPGRTSKLRFKPKLTDENLKRLLAGQLPADMQLRSEKYHPKLVDQPSDDKLLPLTRFGCKMATGSGKTVVMSMLIAWAFCNRGVNPLSTEYPSAVLICAPNLTVKERLQVLRPDNPENYYAAFDIVPVNLRHHLQLGRVLIENWHRFSPESEHKEGDKSYAVVDKGPETPETLARRVLGDLYDRLPIMVLNDEGHHCWRPPLDQSEEDQPKIKKRKKQATEDGFEASEDEKVEARVWLAGLDQINNCLGKNRRGISYCIDLSATPFYLSGSGHPEGQPFPWLVSDFGLIDAIESGIVKIPRLPVADETGKKDEAGRPDPKYFRLWYHINNPNGVPLPSIQRYASGKPKPEICYLQANGALKQIAGQWLERFNQQKQATVDHELVPPVLILVCDNTEIADYFYTMISGEQETDAAVTEEEVEELEAGEEELPPKKKESKPKKQTAYGKSDILDELANTAKRKVTYRIDTKMLAEAESEDPNKGKKSAAEELRKVISTVGKKGEPGEHVRCVVSVSMLTEGWDANNVTHVLGIRAFGSQLLCEQVVGRGLRRMRYEPVKVKQGDKEIELLDEEYVDVYGIPFSVIPYKGRAKDQKTPEDKPKHRVWAVPDRSDLEIRFPIVKNYVYQPTRGLLQCDVDKIEPFAINPKLEPTSTYLRPTAGYVDTQVAHIVAFEFVKQDRQTYYQQTHLQSILFQITQKIINDLLSPGSANDDKRSRVLRLQARHEMFPQVLRYVQQYVATRVDRKGIDARELGLQKYVQLIVERVRDAIHPDASQGEPPLLPILDRYRQMGKTGDVDFPTTRPIRKSERSHINAVVIDSGAKDESWEVEAVRILESDEAASLVKCYARNDHLGLVVPYDYVGAPHGYEPDFIVRLQNDLNVLLEIKGPHVFDKEQMHAKHQAAKRWATAVTNMNDPVFGKWHFADAVRDVDELLPTLRRCL